MSEQATPLLKGNQCENCHGPASEHAANPDEASFRKAMHLTREQVEATSFCNRCHDPENDPHFEFENRYNQIFHKGLDKYDDPKVHARKAPVKVGQN